MPLASDPYEIAPDAGQGIEGKESIRYQAEGTSPMSVDNQPAHQSTPLGGRTTYFYKSVSVGSDDGIDDPLVAGRLDIDLLHAVDISGEWPLHASVYGERTFRTIDELDTLLADLTELRAEWQNLATVPVLEAKAAQA